MATKKTNNEEISKKNSASKKSAEISKTSKKQTASLKKKTDGQSTWNLQIKRALLYGSMSCVVY